MKSLILITLFSTLLSFSEEWKLDFEEAKIEAAQSHKYVLLNFSGSDWCIPCIKLKKNVFESDKFMRFAAENLILVRADFPRLKKNQLDSRQTSQNELLAEKYNNQGKFPLTILLDSNGKVIKTWDGYPSTLSVETFISEINVFVDAKK
ncbi:Thioredoxin-like [Pseudarcicella hirudinis]|uniref:Thioredoxin-like n=1 Tax=Pseudarcicella hirudinis TaxID=1079859 RepID=A0A1I5REM7_9BACT|nr:thioredoxin family protein [Pseudarcicella hirudinis]SFP56830.1 Thioredoxin-like [Pseudarcicella hirudinis]